MRPVLLVLDTETTGLGRQREDAVVEVGLAWRDPDAGIVRTWSSLANPGARFVADGRADGAFRVNGLTVDEVLAAPPAETVAEELRRHLDAVARRHGAFELGAYNTDFDRPFLQAAPWRLAGPWAPCILRAAHARLGGKWPKLVEACRALGVPTEGLRAHRAADDARLALLVAEALAAPAAAP